MRFGFLALLGFLSLTGVARAQGTPPVVTKYPTPITAAIGDTATLSATVEGTNPITYQWFKDGTAIAGATNTFLTFFSLTLADTGVYRLDATNLYGTATTTATYLAVTKRAQTITFNAPTASANGAGVTLNATASSGLPVTLTLVSGAGTLNGNMLNASSGSVVVRASQPGDAVYDAAAPVDRTITFLTGAISPFITSPPADQTVKAGSSVTFRASAIGTPTPTYQWQKDGVVIDGAVSNALTLANVALTDAGRYTVTATNAAGTSTASATLTVQVAPTITQQPAGTTVSAGSTASLTVAVTAVPAATYQWRKNGTAIAGATRDTLNFASAVATDAGRYDVVVTNSLGSVTSNSATLTVNVRDFSGTYLGRINAAGTPNTGQFALLVRPNRSAVLVARTAGNTTALLANFIVDLAGNFSVTTDSLGSVNAPTTIRGAIDEVAGSVSGTVAPGAGQAVPLAGDRSATTDTTGGRAGFYNGAITGSAAARGFAIVAPGGDTLLVVANTNGADSARATLTSAGRLAGTSAAGTAVDVTFATGIMRGTLGAGTNSTLLGALDSLLGAERLANVSVRTTTANAAPLITGFVISGTTPKQVLVRAAGPAIAQAPFNVVGALNDPTLQLFRGSQIAAQNDDWGAPAQNSAAISAAATRTGAFPFRAGSADAAIATTLPPGAYTALIGGGNGIVLAEIYEDLATGEVAGARRLVNLSARGLVSPGSPLIAGFVISGTGPQRVLIRGIGPTLGQAPFNVAGTLPNPQLTIFRDSTALKNNDDWFRDADATLIRDTAARVGAFALGAQSADASILIYLEPGAYTAQVSGPANANAQNGTGIALVEVYEVGL